MVPECEICTSDRIKHPKKPVNLPIDFGKIRGWAWAVSEAGGAGITPRSVKTCPTARRARPTKSATGWAGIPAFSIRRKANPRECTGGRSRGLAQSIIGIRISHSLTCCVGSARWVDSGRFHSLPKADSFFVPVRLRRANQLPFYPQLWWISLVKTIRVGHFSLGHPALPPVCLILRQIFKPLYLFPISYLEQSSNV